MSNLRILLYRIVLGFKAIRLYENWLQVLLSYLGLRSQKMLILRNGTKYEIRQHTKDFQVVNDIYMNRMYHKYLSVLKKGGACIDIGANIGAFSVLAAKQNTNVKVYAYEPFEENVRMLRQNISLNNLSGQINVFSYGVAGKRGKRTLFLDKENSGGHTLYGKGEEVEILVTTLSDIFRENKIKVCDFLKIDCEGAEFEILMSTPSTVLNKVRTITCEFHEYFGAGKVEELRAFLEKQGFKVELTREINSPLGIIYAYHA